MWNGLVKILEITVVSQDGKILWRDENLKNMIHTQGEAFLLNCLFNGGISNTYIPSVYYFGLDNRATINASNTMASISGEPAIHGYSRRGVSSSGQFNVTMVSGVYQAQCPILSFQASGGSWGPVNNLFLTNKSDYTGTLISTVRLSSPITLNNGNSVNLKMALALKDCP